MSKHKTALVLAGIVTFLTACGSAQPEPAITESEPTAAVTEAREETTTPEPEEPTVDEYSEEYYLEQAKELGIADPSYYDRLMADMNNEQFFTMLKNAHDLQYGEDSNCLIDGWLYYVTDGENQREGKEPITLGRIVDVTAMADAVYFRGVERDFTQDFWGAMDGLWEEADLPKCNEYLW